MSIITSKARTSATDTTEGNLVDEIVAGSGLVKSILNSGADEKLQVKLTSEYLALASSGLYEGALLSVGATQGTFDISAGEGVTVDSTTDFDNVEVSNVTISARTNVPVTNIATQPVTYILIDKNDTIIQNTSFPTPEEKRNNIFIGVVVHSDNVNVLTVNNLPSVSLDVSAQLHDLFDGLGFFNESGNIITPNGTNLSFDKSSGLAFKAGANFANNPKDPHTLSLSGQTVSAFRYRTQTSVEGSNVTVIDPTSYDLNGTVTTITGSTNQATLQRIYIFPSNIIRVQYGQQVYPTLSDAVDAVGKEAFVVEPNIQENGLLLATIAVTVDCTALNDTSRALIFSASRFGELGSVGSSAVGTLQQTYNNSIIDPEILTNDINGAVAFRRGTTGGDTDFVIEVEDNAGNSNFSVDGLGNITSPSIGIVKSGATDVTKEYLALGSTSLLTGGVLSVGTPNTTFSISDGKGMVIDETDFENPVITPVSWTGQTNLTVTNLATNLITFVGINSSGTVVQQTGRFTSAQRRSIIVLGVVVHVDNTIVDTVNNEQVTGLAPASQLYDFMESINFFNVSGNQFTPNVGANLQFDKSSGSIFKAGSNYDTDPVNAPHVRPIGAFTPVSFQYRFQDGSNLNPTTSLETAIIPNIYDDGNGATTPGTVPSNRYTIQRVNIFTSGNIKIQPGQTLYNSLASAKEGLQTEAFNTEPSINANGLLRAFIIVKGDATDLTNTGEALFFDAGKFGETSIAGGLSVSTLQSAYNNSTPNPEIDTNDVNGAFTIRRGTTGGDTDIVSEVQNQAGTTTFSIAGDGFVDSEIRQRVLNTVTPTAITKTDGTLLFDSTTTTITVDLPSASIGKVRIPFKDIGANANTNNITLNRVGADTIVTSVTGQTSAVINVNGDYGYLLSNGVDTWYLFGG
jgi:hypothetical protein